MEHAALPFDLTQPQVTAALVGGGVAAAVSLGVAIVNQLSLRSMHRQKLGFDRDQTEQKFEFDKQLAEHKIGLDAALAEKKFSFDKATIAWRRRYELAEQVLIAAYQARDTIGWTRTRVTFEGEGQTRQANGDEGPKLRARRNAHFIPLERLARDSKSFATLETLQYAVAAHFGPSLAKSIETFARVHNEISTAASYLIKLDDGEDDWHGDQSLKPFREVLWGERPDKIDAQIAEAVDTIEAACRPVLAEGPPA